MANTELVVIENDAKYGWCLFGVLGHMSRHAAEKRLAELQEANPDKELRLDEVAKEDCWWHDTRD